MSFQKHLLMRLAVDKLGTVDEVVRRAKPTTNTDPILMTAAQALAAIPFSQRMGAVLRLRLKTILPFFLWTDQSR